MFTFLPGPFLVQFSGPFYLSTDSGKDLNKLDYLLEILEANINKKIEHHLLLPEKYCLHKLIGKYKGYWECHIEPDWLLVYYLDNEVLRLERTGTHNDIFK